MNIPPFLSRRTMNTKRKGDITTTMVAAGLLKQDYSVLMPIGDGERYDLVIEKNGKFQRIQCKTGSLNPKKDRIKFKCFSVHGENGTYTAQKYLGQIEYFGVYVPEIDKSYLIPLNICDAYFISFLFEDIEKYLL